MESPEIGAPRHLATSPDRPAQVVFYPTYPASAAPRSRRYLRMNPGGHQGQGLVIRRRHRMFCTAVPGPRFPCPFDRRVWTPTRLQRLVFKYPKFDSWNPAVLFIGVLRMVCTAQHIFLPSNERPAKYAVAAEAAPRHHQPGVFKLPGVTY